jgi:hypothetical protein
MSGPDQTPRGRYMAHCMGFRHGTAGTFPRGAHLPDYARGYAAWQRAMGEAARAFAEEVGYDRRLGVIDR